MPAEIATSGSLTRRMFAAGISAASAAMIARVAAAQEASPAASPVAGVVTRSLTRDEYLAEIAARYPFEEPANRDGQLIHPVSLDMGTLNPHIRVDLTGLIVIEPLFSNLIKTAPWDASIFAPDLADFWEESGDGLTYTFYLNQNATFHDGTPVTAHDVVFSYDAMLDPSGLATYQSDFRANVKSYRAINDHTFELVALQRSVLFLQNACAGLCVLPKHIWKSVPPAEWGSAPGSTGQDPAKVGGSGPFRFVEWVQGDHCTIARNEAYFVPEMVPSIAEFTVRWVPEESAVIQSFIAGETDMIDIDPQQISAVRESVPEAVFHEYDSWQHYYIGPYQGEGSKFFTDVRVRQALYYGIDRDLIVDEILLGYGVRADGPQPVPSPAYAPDRIDTIYVHDPERANALLDEAGWIDSDGDGIREKDGVKFECELSFVDLPTNQQMVAYVQQAWSEIGLAISPVAVAQTPYVERLTAGTFDLGTAGVTWPNLGDQGAIHSCAAIPPAGFNFVRWCNDEYEELQAQQIVELDPEKRRELLIRMSNIFNDDAGEIILAFLKNVQATQARVKNIFPNAIWPTWALPWVWIDDSAR